MSTATISELDKIDHAIGESTTATAFLQVLRLRELIRLGRASGAPMIDGYPASHAQIALNVQTEHYLTLCEKYDIEPRIKAR